MRDELGEDHSADIDRCNRRSNDDGLPSLHKVITMTRPRVAELETDVGKRNNLSQSLQLGEQECWYILCSLHKHRGATRPYKSRQCVRITTDRRKVDIVDIIYRGTTLLAAKLAGVVHMLCCSTDPPLALQPVHTL